MKKITIPNDNARLVFVEFLTVIFRINQIKVAIPRIKIMGSNNSVLDKKLVLFPKIKTTGNNANRIGWIIDEDETLILI